MHSNSMAIQGCFLWPQKTVDFLLLEMGQERLSLSALCTMSSSSSFFSGIGTAELAWQVIGNALRARGVPFHMRNEFVCEKDGDCQSLLLKQPVQHVFSDICGAVPLLADMDEGVTFEHKQNPVMATWNCTTFCVAPNSASWGPPSMPRFHSRSGGSRLVRSLSSCVFRHIHFSLKPRV